MKQADFRGYRLAIAAVLLLLLATATACGQTVEIGAVDTIRVPDEGRLPYTVLGDDGTLHMVYTQGDPSEGDLLYVSRRPGATEWATPLRVNSAPGTVTGIGPVDGGQLALGPDGRVHVTWMRMAPPAFFYTRSNEDGPGFEKQFDIASDYGVEAGPALTVDQDNNVYLFWHAGSGEDATRVVYLAVSRDGGLVFEPPRQVNAAVEGACACCALAASTDGAGTIRVSYRGARENIHRGQRLLTSHDAGVTFTDQLLQPWDVGACPVAVPSLHSSSSGTTVAWETQGQVQFVRVDRLNEIAIPTGKAALRRKNPTIAVNPRGETLIAWADGSGFRSGGTLHWQLFDSDGQPGETGPDNETVVPENSRPAATTRADGGFVVVY
jgi:hypothetical protein